MGDWPSLGKGASNVPVTTSGEQPQDEIISKTESHAASNEAKPLPEKSVKTVNPTTSPPKQQLQQSIVHAKPTVVLGVNKQQHVSTSSQSRATHQQHPHYHHYQQQHTQQSQQSGITQNSSVATAQNGPITNGHHSNQSHNNNGNNGNGGNSNINNNRRVPKSKWVPLEIELPKARGKPRERNNNISSNKRRDTENETEYYAGEREPRSTRRYRATSYRSGTDSSKTRQSAGSSTRSINVNTATGSTNRTIGAPSGGNPKRSGPIRTSGSIQKARPIRNPNHHSNQNGDFTVDFPVDFSLVKKLVASGTAGVDGTPPFLMSYMGTYYYNGVPSYANIDTSSLKEAIRKQM